MTAIVDRAVDGTADRATSAAGSSSSATAWPAPAPSRRSWPAAGPSCSRSPCSATSRTATTTASCSPTCSRARRATTDIFLNSLAWYAENGITLHAGVRVDPIDRFAQVVFADDGRITPYDKLIIATGSRSFMPPMEGLHGPPTARCCPASSPSAPSTTPAP